MNRRAFFGALAGLAATATLDPERLLWVPGRKLISIPTPVVYRYLTYPFHITANMEGDEDVAKTLQGLMNWRWATDAGFRQRFWDVARRQGSFPAARAMLHEVQGAGVVKTFWRTGE